MKNKTSLQKKESIGKYFLAGIVVSAILFMVFLIINKNKDAPEKVTVHVWTPEADSLFVKNCYNKYKPQVKDDLVKQETMKSFCRCMLAKIKTKYDEKDMGNVTDEEIKKWDAECRGENSTPMFK